MKRIFVYIIAFVIQIKFGYVFGSTNNDCEGGDQGKGSSGNTSGIAAAQGSATSVTSGDPNELHGPAGYDTLRWVSINDVLHYTIFFENSEEIAGANAQIIKVSFTFPYEQMMNSFQLGEYNFALRNYPIASKGNAHKTRIDLRDSMNIYVDVAAGMDVPHQQAYWHFSSIDPVTGIAPWQFDRGLLPVNDSTHVGEGYVTFSMQPDPALHTGDTISFFADILFDQNDTIPTNRWRNYVDAGAPQSTIISTPDEATPSLYHLSFTAADDERGCGVKHVLLYLKDNMGIWQEIASASPDTVIDMQLELGDSYKLISIAEDYVGNREPFKEIPDLILNANLAPTDILLSDSLFRDDMPDSAYIATITSVDTEEGSFTYALAEGEGAIHNDFFSVDGDRLLLRNSLRCVEDSIYQIRLSTTDEGGLTYSKPFRLFMSHVLIHPKTDTIIVRICEGDAYSFHGEVYDSPGLHTLTVATSENQCDSTYVLDVSVLPQPLKPQISIVNGGTLVSSANDGNRWMMCEDVEDSLVSTDTQFTPVEFGRYYVLVDNSACTSEPSDTVVLQARQDSASLVLSLAEGWNWFSSYLIDPTYTDVSSFLQPIQGTVDSICGNTAVVSVLSPSESYKIRTNLPIQHTWRGLACNPSDYPIALRKGWNRIGYPLTYTTNLTNTWSDFLPEEGDIIKSYEAFSIFHDGQWVGLLQTLSQGDGLMYYSQSPKSMRFSTDSVHTEIQPLRAPRANEDMPQNTGLHRYPDNSTLIASLFNLGNEEIPEGLYTVLAYSGEECVGIGSYVENKIHMLMYGDEDLAAPIHFKAYNHITQEYVDIEEQIQFSSVPVGTQANPMILHLQGNLTDVTYVYADALYNIYPNPVRDVLYISGNVEDICSLSIYTLTGKIIKKYGSYSSAGVSVKDIPDGTYMVVVETTDETKLIRKIIKSTAN